MRLDGRFLLLLNLLLGHRALSFHFGTHNTDGIVPSSRSQQVWWLISISPIWNWYSSFTMVCVNIRRTDCKIHLDHFVAGVSETIIVQSKSIPVSSPTTRKNDTKTHFLFREKTFCGLSWVQHQNHLISDLRGVAKSGWTCRELFRVLYLKQKILLQKKRNERSKAKTKGKEKSSFYLLQKATASLESISKEPKERSPGWRQIHRIYKKCLRSEKFLNNFLKESASGISGSDSW